MGEFINIVLTADNNYTDVIGVSMVSVLKNLSSGKTARFFIFSYNFTQNDLNKLNLIKEKFPCEIINVPMEEHMHYFKNVNVSDFKNKWISLACYFRLLIFKILPDDVQNCFYIDGDMIIECDLSLIKLEKEKALACVMEIQAMQHRKDLLSHCYEIEEFKNFQQNAFRFPYFNAGFFLVDLKKARELNIFEQIMDLFKKYPKLPYCDQDLLNMIFGQKHSDLIQFLPIKYNVFADINYNMTYNNIPYSNEEVQSAVSNPSIIHYAGASKPWKTNRLHYFYKNWWKYYKLSPWGKDYLLKQFEIQFRDKINFKNFLQFLFSLRNEGQHKVLTLMGIKVKFKRRKKVNA